MKSSIYIVNYNQTIDKCIINSRTVPYYEIKPAIDLSGCDTAQCNELIGTGFQIKLLFNELEVAEQYRKCLVHKIQNCNRLIVIKLTPPQKELMDLKWNKILNNLVWERAELDNLMSWLSTLGGAYSSLGDDFGNYAEIAGRISMQQLKLALRIGDPITVSRCKLYFILSLIQTGQLMHAYRLLRKEFKFAKTQLEHDKRLYRMCRGIWEKLKYTHQMSQGALTKAA